MLSRDDFPQLISLSPYYRAFWKTHDTNVYQWLLVDMNRSLWFSSRVSFLLTVQRPCFANQKGKEIYFDEGIAVAGHKTRSLRYEHVNILETKQRKFSSEILRSGAGTTNSVLLSVRTLWSNISERKFVQINYWWNPVLAYSKYRQSVGQFRSSFPFTCPPRKRSTEYLHERSIVLTRFYTLCAKISPMKLRRLSSFIHTKRRPRIKIWKRASSERSTNDSPTKWKADTFEFSLREIEYQEFKKNSKATCTFWAAGWKMYGPSRDRHQ